MFFFTLGPLSLVLLLVFFVMWALIRNVVITAVVMLIFCVIIGLAFNAATTDPNARCAFPTTLGCD